MSIMSILLKLARQVVESVMGQLMQQFNVVQEQALSPMKAMVEQVTSGVWVGDGADAFVEEVSSIMIPGVGQVGDHITKMHSDIKFAVDVIDQADAQVNSLVNGLGDIFGGIF